MPNTSAHVGHAALSGSPGQQQDAKVTKEKQQGHEEGLLRQTAFLGDLSAFPLRPSRPALLSNLID
ncbi:MAG: hypothetical protein AB7E72_09885, partial [Lysobacterales bacterium]